MSIDLFFRWLLRRKETVLSQTICSDKLEIRKTFLNIAIYYVYYLTGWSLSKWAKDKAKQIGFFSVFRNILEFSMFILDGDLTRWSLLLLGIQWLWVINLNTLASKLINFYT